MSLKTLFPSDKQTLVMGIINVSADSFFSPTTKVDEVLKRAELMVQSGADCLDIGGEATNPATVLMSEDAEIIERQSALVVETVEALRGHFEIPISVDTSYPAVMQTVIDAGANIINDQRALAAPGAQEVVIKTGVPVVLMHSELVPWPATMQTDITARVIAQWQARIDELLAAGLKKEQVILDPGFGQGHFGKNLQENYQLLRELPVLMEAGYPVLVGWSRKSMIGDVSGGCPPVDRLPGSLAAAVLAAQAGARFVRVHDVAETVQALSVLNASLV